MYSTTFVAYSKVMASLQYQLLFCLNQTFNLVVIVVCNTRNAV